MQVYHDGSNSYITNSQGALKIATESSGIAVTIGHTTSEVTIADNLTITGTLTLGSNAELTEAELEFLDGITAGTAAASKAMVLDSNADITGGRNLTISGELDAATLDISGNADIDGTTNLDVVDIDGAVQLDATFTVGVDDTGYDVKFFGATSGAYMLWDESTDDLVLAGAAKLYLYDAAGGEYLSSSGSALTIASGSAAWELPAADGSANQVLKTDGSGNLDWTTVSGTITALNNQAANRLTSIGSTTTELDGEANLTFTGSALTCIGTVTVGVDNTGHDVKYFGATSGKYWLWDESADGVVQIGTLTVGVDDAGHDVKLFGATASSYALWDESADSLLLNAATLDLNGTADGLILDANGNTTISSPTDDQIDFEIAGADDFTMTANTFTILSGSTIAIAAGGAITNAGSMAPDITSTGKALVFGF